MAAVLTEGGWRPWPNYWMEETMEDAERFHEPIMQFFEYSHLPTALQAVSVQFQQLAHSIVSDLPRNPERTVALRKLLEAKDAAVRARIFK